MKIQKDAKRMCFADVVVRDFVYVCHRAKKHRHEHVAVVRNGKTKVILKWI